MATLTPLFGLFAKSPLGPIQQHMTLVHQTAKMLPEFFRYSQAGKWEKAEQVYLEICRCESEADNVKRELRLSLPKGLFLVVSRSDLLDLLSKQDKIANKSQDIAGLCLGRKMQFPDTLEDAFITYIKRSIDATKQAKKAINELDELLATGFKGKEVELVENMIKELTNIESDTDKLQRKIRKQLFKIESELPPVEVMFLYKIIDWLGDLADRAQSVGFRLEIMMAN